jgi:hypothetical protein
VLSALRAPTPKGAALLSDLGSAAPVVVYTGPTRANPDIGPDIADEPAAAHGHRHGQDRHTAKSEPDAREPKAARGDKPDKADAAHQTAPAHRKSGDKKAEDKSDGKAKPHSKQTGARSSDAAPAAPPAKREAQSDAPTFNAPPSGVLPKPHPQPSQNIAD